MNNTNKRFLMIISLVLISFIFIGIKANRQKNENKYDYEMYEGVKELVKSEANLDIALAEINKLQAKDENNYIFNIEKSNIYIKMGKYEESYEELKKALEIRAVLGEEPGFSISYTSLAILNEDYKNAEKMLKKLKKLKKIDTSHEQKDRIKELEKELS